jgi:hypothetical protein
MSPRILEYKEKCTLAIHHGEVIIVPVGTQASISTNIQDSLF